MNPYANTYKTQQIQTASQEQLLIMLYEGAIRFLNLAKAGHEEQNFEKFHNNIVKTQRIILEFMSTLDLDVGGDMAQNLFKLYEYLHYQLLQANLKKDVSMVEEVLMHLRELKETWEEAIGQLQKQQTLPADFTKDDHVYSA
jgi:flagellar secretion chaperone FliS